MSASATEETSITNDLSEWVKFNPLSPLWDCKGKCAATVFAGPQLTTDLGQAMGTLAKAVPPWQYTYGNGSFVGGTLSEALVEFRDLADFEGEVGVGQRLGNQHESEVWLALYARWKWFPWNRFITTTVAVSTGLNYASGVSQYELEQSGIQGGSNLLHYFSPEITFALPSKTDWQFLIRYHHRSGGGAIWGYTPLFKGVDGGTQYLVFGLRHWF